MCFSAEAIFLAIAKGIIEVLWIRKSLKELGFPPKRNCKPYCVNKASISNLENPVQHNKTKHVEIEVHFVKENLELNILLVFLLYAQKINWLIF